MTVKMHTIAHQLAASTWSEGPTDIVASRPEYFWRVIQSEPHGHGRFMVSWIDGKPDTAFVIDRDGVPLLDQDTQDTAAGIATLWEADRTSHD